MYKRFDPRWFRDPNRDEERTKMTEHFYGQGYVTHGLRDTINRKYGERRYPTNYQPRKGHW